MILSDTVMDHTFFFVARLCVQSIPYFLRVENKIHDMEQDIIQEISKLLERTGLDGVIAGPAAGEKKQYLETTLINLKSLNARYDKSEAISQVQWLMYAYNIQIDELIERIGSR